MTALTEDDLQRMRDQLFFEGPERARRLSRYWLLLVLAAVIASAGIMSDSTATVIGAMIVAPLMTPILGTVLAVVLTDGTNLRRCVLWVVLGAAAVVGISWALGFFVPYPVVAANNSQVAARVTPRLVDLLAALATGAVGSVALARSDISDTLPGVAIAISLVPPLAVVGLTLKAGVDQEALGALLLFGTNVAAILASGIVVMALYRTSRVAGWQTGRTFRWASVAIIAVFLAAVIVPLNVNSDRVNRTTVNENNVAAVANRWAEAAGWAVVAVTGRGNRVLVDTMGPLPEPALAGLRRSLRAAGLGGLDVQVRMLPGHYVAVSP